MRRTKLYGVACLALVALVACNGDGESSPDSTGDSGGAAAENLVEVRQFAFAPGAIEIRRGETITWLNNDDIEHTVTSGMPGSESGVFKEVMPGEGKRSLVTFSEAGTFQYFCSRHEFMTGSVIVL